MKITLRTVSFDQLRNYQPGDWKFLPDGSIEVLAGEMKDERHVILMLAHELVEALLCRVRGISDEIVTTFDKEFEANRKPGDNSECGASPLAPYRREHFAAETIERIMASELGVVWEEYADAVEAFPFSSGNGAK